MRTLLLLFCVSVFFFSSCKTDGSTSKDEIEAENSGETTESSINLDDIDLESTEKVELEVKMDEAIKEDQLAKKLIVESKNKEVSEIAKVEDKNETKLVGKSEAEKKKEAEMKIEATKKMIEKSVNKGKSCEQILKEQVGFVDDFEKTKDRKIILKMAKAKNDPFFAECIKTEKFATKMDELTTRLETIMDQE